MTQSSGDRDLLVEQHMPYVRALAVKIQVGLRLPTDLDELVAVGYLGLVEAAERYDAARGVSFSTFSYYRIRGAIFDALRRSGSVPRADRARAHFAGLADDLLKLEVDDEYVPGRKPSLSLNDEIESIQTIIEQLIPVFMLSLDELGAREQRDPLVAFAENIEQQDLLDFTLTTISELSADDREIINGVYFRNLTLSEIAVEFGVTKSWISRLHARAIRNLRDRMRHHGLLDST